MRSQQRALARYVNTATDLAEAIKKDIQHGGTVTDETVLRLNEFRIAANTVQDMLDEVVKKSIKYEN